LPGEAGPFRAEYIVHEDHEATRRVSLALMRRTWHRWLNYGFSLGFAFALFGLMTWIITSYYVGAYSTSGLLATFLFCMASGLLAPVLNYLQAWDRREWKKRAPETWTCVLTDEGWSYRNVDGLLRFIPWTAMSLRYEHKDGWLIQFGSEEVLVFRSPLREAGLEEEFRKRMRDRQRRL